MIRMNKAFLFRLTVILIAWLWTFMTAAGILPKSLPGGYAPADLGSEVRAVADFAISEESKREGLPLKLSSISSAEKQIVAGTNYRLILTVERTSSTRQAKVVVFRDLKSRYRLKSWEWL
jgi:Aspartic acid proteinase inhibitor